MRPATISYQTIPPMPFPPRHPPGASALFCGDGGEPLLVQRIGRARAAGGGGADTVGTGGGEVSGATAVPYLGYVRRERSVEEGRLMEAAEIAVAEHWEGGKSGALPTPPPGFQWELPHRTRGNTTTMDGGEGCTDIPTPWAEDTEHSVVRTAELIQDTEHGNKTWRFAIDGIPVEPFDARAVISPCALDLHDPHHRPIPLVPGSERDRCLRIALYVPQHVYERIPTVTDSDPDDDDKLPPHGEEALNAMERLHQLATADRTAPPHGPSEGDVYDWLPSR